MSTFSNSRLYPPSIFEFGTCSFTVLFSNPIVTFSFSPLLICAFVTLYSPFTIPFVTSISITSIILLYPSGAFVSSTLIISVPSSVISIPVISIFPSSFVITVLSSPFSNVILNSAPLSTLLNSSLSTFSNSRLYPPSIFEFGTVIVTIFPSYFAFISASSNPVPCAFFNFMSVILYAPSDKLLVISICTLSNNLLYPSGAFVSFIVIVSMPSSSIFIPSILTIPCSSVVNTCFVPSANITSKIAPLNTSFEFPLSTFNICKLYVPSAFLFGIVTFIIPFSDVASTLPSAIPVPSNSFISILPTTYWPFNITVSTSNSNVFIILLYPSGAFVSSINIVSVPSFVISISGISIFPSPFVVTILSSPFGNVTLNSAPLNFFCSFSASILLNSNPYLPVTFPKISFSKSSSSCSPL